MIYLVGGSVLQFSKGAPVALGGTPNYGAANWRGLFLRGGLILGLLYWLALGKAGHCKP